MEEEILERIDNKLSVIIHLLSGNVIEGKNKTESIITLATLGIDADMIASIVGTTVNTVSVRLYEAKKKEKTRIKK